MSIKHPGILPGHYSYVQQNRRPKDFEIADNPQKRSQTIHYPNPLVPGGYAHIAKEPNTDTLKQAYEEKFMKINLANMPEDHKVKDEETDKIIFGIKVEKRVEYKQIKAAIEKKVDKKIRAYEEEVDKRRKKLHDLLYEEERQYYRESVELAQKADERRLNEIKRTIEMVKSKREEERQQLVHKKKIQQYIGLCEELKPAIIKKHLIECKDTWFQQMRENEARRQSEKELDRMWHELCEKENRAKIERDERELLAKKAEQLELQEILRKQVRGKELLRAEEKRMMLEDKLETENRIEKARQLELQNLRAKKLEKETMLRELKEQIHEHEEKYKKEKEEEEAINYAYNYCNKLEIEKERRAKMGKAAETKKECDIYKKFLKELEMEQKKQEKELEAALDIYRKDIEQKQDDAQCKVIFAREELKKSVLEGRAQQVALKRQKAENELKAKQAENELLRLAYETNERLQAESDRLEKEAIRQYREDLKQQIEYNNLVRERERQELERQLQKGKEEEEKYQKLVKEIIKVNTESPDMKHPFRTVLERYDCRCTDQPS